MFRTSSMYLMFLSAMMLGNSVAPAWGQSAASRAEREVAQASQQGKYTFLVFYQQQDAATDAMVGTLKQSLTGKAEKALISYVQVGDPAEQGLVKKYGVTRAPMPLTIALAPNGAITAISPRRIDATKINDAFVTPAGAASLKALQEQKIVFVAVHSGGQLNEPQVIAAFSNDPHFRERMGVVAINANDEREKSFLKDLTVDGSAHSPASLVVLAPPGVMVGKFSASATKAEIAAAIAEAGKCCDDPTCNHNK